MTTEATTPTPALAVVDSGRAPAGPATERRDAGAEKAIHTEHGLGAFRKKISRPLPTGHLDDCDGWGHREPAEPCTCEACGELGCALCALPWHAPADLCVGCWVEAVRAASGNTSEVVDWSDVGPCAGLQLADGSAIEICAAGVTRLGVDDTETVIDARPAARAAIEARRRQRAERKGGAR